MRMANLKATKFRCCTYFPYLSPSLTKNINISHINILISEFKLRWMFNTYSIENITQTRNTETRLRYIYSVALAHLFGRIRRHYNEYMEVSWTVPKVYIAEYVNGRNVVFSSLYVFYICLNGVMWSPQSIPTIRLYCIRCYKSLNWSRHLESSARYRAWILQSQYKNLKMYGRYLLVYL